MATSHPYISGAGNVTAIINQLRKNFPATVTSETVKKFGLASNNESYLINAKPIIKLTNMSDMSEEDEQKGFRHMFAGSAVGIRNPRGHKVNLSDPIALCLDHLSVASVLLRRLENRIAP